MIEFLETILAMIGAFIIGCAVGNYNR